MRCFLTSLVVVFVAGLCFGDTLTLRNGRTVQGTYLGGTAREVRIEIGDRIETFGVESIADLQFTGGSNTAESQPVESRPAPAPERPYRDRDRDRDAASAGIEIPAGTVLTVRMIDAVDSQVAHLGDTFHASIDEPVMVNGETVIPRGADVIAKLVDDKQSGKIAGRTMLALALVSVRVNNRMVDVSTQDVVEQSSSRGARSGKVIGGTTALGAIIGGLAGGGKGAAIGAGAGAAAGTGAEVATKGQRVRIPSETRLRFTLSYSVRV